MASYDYIARARSVPIVDVLAPRGHNLRRCGGELVGPCPVCGGRDRFAVNLKKAVWNCRGCGKGGDVIELVRHLDGCGFNHAIEQLTGERSAAVSSGPHNKVTDHLKQKAKAEDAERQREQHRKAAWFWSQRQPIKGTIAERYLRQVRGITCPLPATLGYLPARKSDHHPALISAFALVDEVEPGVLGDSRGVVSVHFTLLKPDGSGKAEVEKPKIMIGSPGNLPIIIAPANDLLGLAITEGIEDALTVHQATGLGAWAAGSAGRMPGLAETVPESIECITICADADQAGRDGAFALADALARRGVEVFVEGLP